MHKVRKMFRKPSFCFFIIVAMALSTSGCAALMAAHQPTKVDEKVLLREKMPREALLGEFGEPVSTEVIDGQTVDIFQYKRGSSRGAKIGRCFFHSIISPITFFLWEPIGMSYEGACMLRKKTVQITYDEKNRVKTITPLKKWKRNSGKGKRTESSPEEQKAQKSEGK